MQIDKQSIISTSFSDISPFVYVCFEPRSFLCLHFCRYNILSFDICWLAFWRFDNHKLCAGQIFCCQFGIFLWGQYPSNWWAFYCSGSCFLYMFSLSAWSLLNNALINRLVGHAGKLNHFFINSWWYKLSKNIIISYSHKIIGFSP